MTSQGADFLYCFNIQSLKSGASKIIKFTDRIGTHINDAKPAELVQADSSKLRKAMLNDMGPLK